MNGVIIIDKPRGKTSHDMVSCIRRLYNTRKVGHTGTLDPEATGVLPICIGNATKACELLTNARKEYTAQLVLGMTTDTLDAEGEVLTEQPVNVTEEQIKKVISEFIGEIYQIPPMYSAIKQNGKKLYELARQGISVEREKRKITIFNIDILDIDTENETVTIHVVCSKGTYIRTLCEDIGMKLGCGAYMNTLRRTASGQFSIDDAYTIEQLESISDTETLEKILIPTDSLFFMYEKITVNERQKNFILNGVRVRYRGLCENRIYRVYDEQDNFLCISQCVEERLTIIKFFKS
ncbi:MAG: tRNA pseudouridine(55) synthase TruB [Clostridia bacterium]|nr:tRNA pseudouridine(55) synthase TruB [Clostridia bacterium]